MKKILLYDINMGFKGVLDNATNKGYEKILNDIWTATFTLPANDPKNKLCTPFSIIEFFDGDERIDLFRILPSVHTSGDNEELIVYDCEHVISTLVDDLLFQYHEQDSLNTEEIIEYLLSFQSTVKWQIGQVDFAYIFAYKWESENILGGLFSVAEPLPLDFQWTWDTTSLPWTLNLIAPSTVTKTRIHYGRNLKHIEKTVDPTDLCTRMYCLGYGEGVNQLTISDINGGLPYIDADTIGTYGVISKVFADTKEENIETLKAKAEAYLPKLKIPKISYAVGAAHIHQITNKNIDDFYIGAYCAVTDKDDNLNFTARVVNISKPYVDEEPGNIDIEISNKTVNIASSISTLINKQRINDVYSQGATNILAQDFADNCDATYPAVLKFYVPEETVRVNKMEINYKTSYFRAYSKSVKSGGASTETSDSGGGATETSYQGAWSAPISLIPCYQEDEGDPPHNHNTQAYNHTHNVDIPSHDHDVNIPNHIHGIDYGIFVNATLPTSIILVVDGNVVPGVGLNEDKIDLVPYLSTDGNGKITRGVWHEIRLLPDDLARIEANIVTQLFIQSRGGGNF